MTAGLDRDALLEDALLAAVPVDGPGRYLYDPMREFLRRSGKRLRPGLCLAACEATGGEPASALHAAVALELLHASFLVHDDIEDDSNRRRGRPTLHRVLDERLAWNVGDGLAALAQAEIVRAIAGARPLATELATEFAHLMRRTVEGQATELGWSEDGLWSVTDDDYLGMVRDKTCWYSFIHPLRIGALIGSGGRFDLDRLINLGFLLGAAFQILDDLQNLTSSPDSYDKDIGGDLVEGKRTLPVLHLLRVGGPSAVDELRSHLGPRCELGGPERLRIVLPLLESAGSLDHARRVGQSLVGAAFAEMEMVFEGLPASGGLTTIGAIIDEVHTGLCS